MSWKRLLLTAFVTIAGLALALGLMLLLTVRSAWFYNKVRQEIVAQVEKATGGRVELASFRFDWKQMRAQADGLTVHGKEPADKLPLLHASSVAAVLKIVSLWKRDVDVSSVEVNDPHVYLIVNSDGSTNLPEPKTPRDPNARPLDPLFRLAAARFDLRRGIFEVEAHGRTPFDASGRNLDLALFFDPSGPRYHGNVSMEPLDLHSPGMAIPPLKVNASIAAAHNRIEIARADIATARASVHLAGAIDDLQSPHGEFRYQARSAAAEIASTLEIKLLERGTVQSQGTLTWKGGADYTVAGDLHAAGVEYPGAYVQLRNARADGTLAANPQGVELKSLRFATSVGGPGRCHGTVWPCPTELAGSIGDAQLHGRDLDLRGIAVGLLGGSFRGNARLTNLERFDVAGEVSGIDARRAVSVYSAEALPWDGLIFGQTHVQGLLRRQNELRASLDLTLAPAPQGPPVHGQLSAVYDTRGDRIDVARATFALPASRAGMSGTVGQKLLVKLETRDLNDLLPALGQSAAALPVKLQNGSASFEGNVTGSLRQPEVAGHVTAANVIYRGESIDSLQADVDATETSLRLRNAAASRGTLRGQFDGIVALHQWKPEDTSLIDGTASIHDAPVKDLASIALSKPLPASGTVNATARINGTIGAPLVDSNLLVTNGDFEGEPFDRFTGHLRYSQSTLELTEGQVAAGPKSARLSARFDHAPGVFTAGQVHFDVATNAMPLDRIHTVVAERPTARGSLEVTAKGALDLSRARNGAWDVRVLDLSGDISTHALELNGQPLGDPHITMSSQGRQLHAHLESAFANSVIKGDASWRLEGDDPGSGTITFSRADFAALNAWLRPASSGPLPFAGYAEGQVHFEGPLLNPASSRAELRIPTLEISAQPPAGPRPAAAPPSLTLRNAGPIVATLNNSVLTVTSAHLVGHDTDLTITGKVSPIEKAPLDLRVNGRVDLGIVHDFNRDLLSSGTVSADATIRGALSAPQVSGRVAFQNATFRVSDLPNGISAANGAILFTGDRATIQNFTGETGGGKITLSGFAAYSGAQPVFRLHARVDEVRLRYPEGVSTVANASLNFTGTVDSSMLSGTITVLRTAFNPQSDFSSIIAASAEPVRTPSAGSGILGGMNFDIQIQTAPDIQVQSSLTQDIAMEATLHLRGTFSNPAVLGRVNISRGQVIFFGTKYNINQGSIAFYNPVRVEPVLDIDLETKARGIDVTLTVSGPLGKLNLTPRSDPPLQFNEIVALLATGRAPTNDPTMLAQQATAPQSWQQMGASALLGQAIASPVTGRLQRFFGVSKLRIDPTLPGIEYNPQARLTLEQQVTSEITFTYITNVTNSNPQVVQVEWAFAKQWSVVALREENGMFGIDFYFKKRF